MENKSKIILSKQILTQTIFFCSHQSNERNTPIKVGKGQEVRDMSN